MAKLLEILNQTAVVPDVILLSLLGMYFCREARRRQLRAFDWLHLDEGMTFALATTVLLFFLAVRFLATVLWYVIGQKLVPVQMLFLIGILGIIAGFLCMIRAITRPYHGNIVWIASIGLTLAFAFVLLATA